MLSIQNAAFIKQNQIVFASGAGVVAQMTASSDH